MTEARPEIFRVTGSADLRRWYWLKTELAVEAKRLGIKSSGAKFTILERLCHYHDTGALKWPGDTAAAGTSKFDWRSAELTKETVVTDNYKNTQNVRRYFQTNVDPAFKFNIALLDWFKSNVGKTLRDAENYWRQQNAAMQGQQTNIKQHNQFNQYARDFIADNPSLGMKGARRFWKLKRALPSDSGLHRYEPTDLKLTDEE